MTPGASPDEAAFRCYVAIWQHLPDSAPALLTHARFGGTFRLVDGSWRWHDHVMEADYAGDLSHHIKGGLASVATS